MIRARVGQGRYRDELLERWGGTCAVTGSATIDAIVASHIKPWRLCSNIERVDAANGLPLVGTLDRLFDYGLISFDETGRILLSPRIPLDEYPRLNLSTYLRLRMLLPETMEYLAFHREGCFWENVYDEDDDED